MKKVGLILMFTLLLTGCGAQETFETLGNVWEQGNDIQAKQVVFAVPEDAAGTVSADTGTIWFCDGYEITLETCTGGDLGRTVLEITGYSKDALTCMETSVADIRRCECVWTAAGENGDQVCRAVILDDGIYHYVLTVMAPAGEAGSLQESWEELFASVSLQG